MVYRGLLPFSVASGRGLIEATAAGRYDGDGAVRFPWHRAAASLKQDLRALLSGFPDGFPWHRAAASLKLFVRAGPVRDRRTFSVASGRGLIEAPPPPAPPGRRAAVFRGIGPRPH